MWCALIRPTGVEARACLLFHCILRSLASGVRRCSCSARGCGWVSGDVCQRRGRGAPMGAGACVWRAGCCGAVSVSVIVSIARAGCRMELWIGWHFPLRTNRRGCSYEAAALRKRTAQSWKKRFMSVTRQRRLIHKHAVACTGGGAGLGEADLCDLAGDQKIAGAKALKRSRRGGA